MNVTEHQLAAVSCWCGKPLVCPEILDAEILYINDVLRRNGFEHLAGARGVEAAIDLLTARAVAGRQSGQDDNQVARR